MQQKDKFLLRSQMSVKRPAVSSPWPAQDPWNRISCGQNRVLNTQVPRFFLRPASSSNHFALCFVYLWLEKKKNNTHSPNKALTGTNSLRIVKYFDIAVWYVCQSRKEHVGFIINSHCLHPCGMTADLPQTLISKLQYYANYKSWVETAIAFTL